MLIAKHKRQTPARRKIKKYGKEKKNVRSIETVPNKHELYPNFSLQSNLFGSLKTFIYLSAKCLRKV